MATVDKCLGWKKKSKALVWIEWAAFSFFAALTLPFRLLQAGPRPLFHGLIYVRTDSLAHAGKLHSAPKRVSRIAELLGKVVIGGDWDLVREPLEDTEKRRTLIALAEGLGPVASGYVERLQKLIEGGESEKGAVDLESAFARAACLEQIINHMRASGRLMERKEIEPWTFRERGGINVAICRDGTVVKVRDGDHRFTFSQALSIEAIPVSVVAVHPLALQNGSYRKIEESSRALRRKVLSRVGPIGS